MSIVFIFQGRRELGRGLVSVKFAIEHEQRNLSFYVHSSEDPYIMQVATNYPSFVGHGRQYKQSNDMERLQTWKSKPLHGQRLRTMFVLKCSGRGCDLVMSVRKWKDFYLLPKNRHCLLMQLKHIFIIVSVQPGTDYVVEQMKLLTILLVFVLFWYNRSINPDMIVLRLMFIGC